MIHGGNGLNLIIGGTGHDFIVTGEDISQTFGGPGNDFILGAKTDAFPTGNEGDDWIQLGTQDGAPGDNFDPLGQDTVSGNDVIVGGGGFDEMLGEGGDDLFVGSEGEDHFDGDSGFDWVTFKNDTRGVTADMLISDIIEPPVAPSNAGVLDRYAFVEGLSGSAFSDFLRGDDADAVDILAGGTQGSVLTQEGIARIAGLQELLGAGVTTFGAGNIILGGSGSDLIEGRGGNDIIDGDSWLNVRISIRAAIDANGDPIGAEIGTTDHMTSVVSSADPALNGKTLVQLMLAGTLNPGQLSIVREILSGEDDFDTALFSGPLDNYDFVIAADGTITITDTVGTDGTDTLKSIERLQFADTSVNLAPELNSDPEGQAAIFDAVSGLPLAAGPLEGQLLRASVVGVTDADNAGGVITGPVSIVWQSEVDPGTGIFEDIVEEGGDKAATASGPTFRVSDGLAGSAIRVKVLYQDANGVLETAFSATTAAVVDVVFDAPAAPPVESSTDSAGVHFIRSDLQFILDQIKLSEAHTAAGGSAQALVDLLPNSRGAFGLRTVDGSLNNLVPGQEHFGAADQNFPSLLDQVFRDEQDGEIFDANGPGPGGVVNNTNYAAPGSIVDSDPRLISNLIVDQTSSNPAAVAANAGAEFVTSPGLDGVFGTADDVLDLFFIGNTAPDEGLSAGFNAWMTFFGQFFDHGLDLVNKGGNGTIYIPLLPDDPLYVEGSFTNFMVLTRLTNIAVHVGEDGVLNTADDVHFHNNQTTPFVDQNQTYTSHPSHQVFLREYVLVDHDGNAGTPMRPFDTGRLLEGSAGGLATWADVKTQALNVLGIALDDLDVLNLPMLATDIYGNFIPGANGLPQIVTLGGQVEGSLDDSSRCVAGYPHQPCVHG